MRERERAADRNERVADIQTTRRQKRFHLYGARTTGANHQARRRRRAGAAKNDLITCARLQPRSAGRDCERGERPANDARLHHVEVRRGQWARFLARAQAHPLGFRRRAEPGGNEVRRLGAEVTQLVQWAQKI